MSDSPEIFFHVGLGKVASTYLQHRVFPRLKNITYIPSNRYKRSKQIIRNSSKNRFLVSREFDRQLEREVRDFVQDFPQTRIIILFRRHDSWIASQYKRYVKNGFYLPFQSFFDLDRDEGFWKKSDLQLFTKVRMIEKYSGLPPLVLFYDDMKSDPWNIIDQICHFSGATCDKDQISVAPVHKSFDDKQLKILRAFCARYVKKIPRGYRNRWANWIRFRPWWAFFHLILYFAKIVPSSWAPSGELIDPAELERIKKAYEADWLQLKQYSSGSLQSVS